MSLRLSEAECSDPYPDRSETPEYKKEDPQKQRQAERIRSLCFLFLIRSHRGLMLISGKSPQRPDQSVNIIG